MVGLYYVTVALITAPLYLFAVTLAEKGYKLWSWVCYALLFLIVLFIL